MQTTDLSFLFRLGLGLTDNLSALSFFLDTVLRIRVG